MVRLDLSEDDSHILLTALESYVSDLRMEIADTDSFDFREGLKDRKEVLNKVIEALRSARQG
jgi:hypothetical protein